MRYLRLLFLISLLAGCRTFEIGVVQTPASNRLEPAPTRTLTLPATATIKQPTVESSPTVIPTATMTPTPTRRPTLRSTSTPLVPSSTPATAPDYPSILNFSIEPLEVDPGDIVTLRWSAANVDAVDIYQRVPDTLPFYDTVNLPAAGQITQTIRDRQRLWQAFDLSASNAFGVITRTISVTVRCPYTYFFSPLPAEDRDDWSCPDGEPIASAAAEQAFENGRMIWLQHDDRIYVFFTDGTYQTFEDTWVAGQPDTDPTLVPPAGRTVPVRGFGKVWSGDAEVRARLGWALAAERGFETQIQGGWLRCCSRLNGVNRPIYVRNSEGRIIRLWPGELEPGQWKWLE